jgi:NAD-dependent SIR2 family protein deacetylase
MSKIVFILGAGASVHCGTPLMGNFLEVAEDLFRSGEVDEVKEDFKSVFTAVGQLHAAQSKAIINTYNIEDVYAAFEMGVLLGRLPGIEETEKIKGLTASIRKVIGYTLEKTTKLPNATGITAFHLYRNLSKIIHRLIIENRSVSVLTFNYDLGLEYSLYANKIVPDYCLGDLEISGKSVPYLKLHGSINWGRCSNETCRKIVPYRNFDSTESKTSHEYSILPIISKLKRLKCYDPRCNGTLEEDPFIVPPTWNKTAFHEQIEQVWRRAANELRDAEHIFVVGYSFPNTDMFFRYLFALGIDVKTILRGFYVYNTDPQVEERFRELLGSGIKKKFNFYPYSFEDALGINQGSILISGTPGLKTIPEILNIKEISNPSSHIG